jgi:hypothetical protein
MMGVPAEVMKLLAALGRVEAIDSLTAVRRTPIDADDPVLNDRATTERHIPSIRQEPPLRCGGDVTFSRSDFAYDLEGNAYVCPGGKELKKYNRASSKPRHGLTKDGTATPCTLSQNAARTCQRARSRAPLMKPLATRRAQSSRPRPTSSHVGSERRSRCSLPSQARLRGPSGAKDEFLLAPAHNLRKLAKLIPFHQQSSPQNAGIPKAL